MITLLGKRGTWNYAMSKALTDGVWWFYLFWLPKYLHERFQVDMNHLGRPLILIYLGATAGSIGGGWMSGFAIKRGLSPRKGRRLALMICALFTSAVVLVPFTQNLWQAIAVLCLATAAHQGWSSNLLSTPSDMFASSSVGTVVGIGGAIGSVGSAVFTALVGSLWTHCSLLIFFMAGSAYLVDPEKVVFQIVLNEIAGAIGAKMSWNWPLMPSRARRKVRQKAPRSLWKFIAAVESMALIVSP
jgi:ACS family hexuronate transporter-like MFS transporter